MDGEVEITLGERKETLRCTLRAARAVDSLGGFTKAFELLQAFRLDAYVTIIAAGTSKKPSEIEDDVFKAGLPNLVEPLAEYVGLLCNGGRPLTKTEGETPKGEA